MKQITIYDLLPLLKKGWVAMDANGNWMWYTYKPIKFKEYKCWLHRKASYLDCNLSRAFNIAPFDGDWKDSLIKVEHKEEEFKKNFKKLLKRKEDGN